MRLDLSDTRPRWLYVELVNKRRAHLYPGWQYVRVNDILIRQTYSRKIHINKSRLWNVSKLYIKLN